MWNNDRWSRGLALTNGVTISIICDNCNLGRLHKFYTPSFLFTKTSIFPSYINQLNKWWIWAQEMQKRIGRRARERENWSNFAEWPSLLLPNVKPTILENRKLTICKGVGQSNTNWDSCTNIFSQEISKIKYAIIVSIQVLLTYLLIYFFVYATTRRRHTGGKNTYCVGGGGGEEEREK